MFILGLAALGLCLGSFVNALVWRVHEQESITNKKRPSKKYLNELSIIKGRSMCPICKHELVAKDLVPVFSWLSLRGKCRYCHKPISAQYPLVELATSGLFVASYIGWPTVLSDAQIVVFGLWLMLLTGLMALIVYDIHWMLLPNRMIYPLILIASAQALIIVLRSDKPVMTLLNVVLSVAVGGGLFYVLYQVSKGKWIGGGDVKLGWLLGLIVGTPARALLLIFLAAVLGSLVSLPLLIGGRLKRSSIIPFGPFLIGSSIIVILFGDGILDWYQKIVLITS